MMLGLFLLAGLLAFASHCYRVMNAPVIAEMDRKSGSYPCIGKLLNPKRPRFDPEFSLARHYLWAKGVEGPSLSWPFQAMFATWAIEASTTEEKANRMYAASSFSRFRSFDHVALTYAGVGYCRLDAGRKQAVLDFYWMGSRFPIDAAMRARAGVPK